MNPESPTTDPAAATRRLAYFFFIAVAAGMAGGRILSTQRVYEPGIGAWPAQLPVAMPTHGGNDRSRWSTIRALVDEGDYSIGKRTEFPDYGELRHAPVQMLFFARVLGHGQAALTALPPGPLPLPPPMYVDSGITVERSWETLDKVLHPGTKRFYSSKPPLLTTILAGEYWVLKQTLGWNFKDNPWEIVRTILFTVNWLPMVIYLLLIARLVERLGTTDAGRLLVVATACFGTLLNPFLVVLNNHTIAAHGAMFSLYAFITIRHDGKQDWWRYALAGFFGAWTACNELPAAAYGVALFALLARHDLRRTLCFFVPASLIPISGFLFTNYLAIGEILPAYEKFGTLWYNYPGSYWNARRGIDAGNDPVGIYAFHLLLGHHGIFSLSPIFVLTVIGMLAPRLGASETEKRPRVVAYLALGLTLVLLAFYCLYSYYVLTTRNYGGFTSGPRWFYWLIPFWLVTMIPVADWCARSRARLVFAMLLLACSVMSASYPAWNPWRHPWLYNLLEYTGVIRY